MSSSVGRTSMIHKPVLRHLCSRSTTLLRYLTVQLILVNFTLHPALHIFTIKIRECNASPGTMWATHACAGSSGIATLQSCVDCTFAPSEIITISELIAGTISVTGAFVTRKLLVALESRIAHSLISSWEKSNVCRKSGTVSFALLPASLPLLCRSNSYC